ncbi:MAG TPA: hypothetical protein VLA51_05955 [Paracoccaceae bacterium]|nr:hypothetical protein [Paracoccaceae bacterium]
MVVKPAVDGSDMGQFGHVLLLAVAGRPFLPGEDAALADPEDEGTSG